MLFLGYGTRHDVDIAVCVGKGGISAAWWECGIGGEGIRHSAAISLPYDKSAYVR